MAFLFMRADCLGHSVVLLLLHLVSLGTPSEKRPAFTFRLLPVDERARCFLPWGLHVLLFVISREEHGSAVSASQPVVCLERYRE